MTAMTHCGNCYWKGELPKLKGLGYGLSGLGLRYRRSVTTFDSLEEK